jgi:hypothetical protein
MKPPTTSARLEAGNLRPECPWRLSCLRHGTARWILVSGLERVCSEAVERSILEHGVRASSGP